MLSQSPKFLTSLPDAEAPEQVWRAHKKLAFEHVVTRIKEIDDVFAADPGGRLTHIRALRGQHHLLVIADRIRRSSIAAGLPPPPSLADAAQHLIDKPHFLDGAGSHSLRRTHTEENFQNSARVSWHQLLKRAGSTSSERRGVPSPQRYSPLTGSNTELRKLQSEILPTPEGGEILRRYMRDRIRHLLAACDKAASGTKYLTPHNKRLIRMLEKVLNLASED